MKIHFLIFFPPAEIVPILVVEMEHHSVWRVWFSCFPSAIRGFRCILIFSFVCNVLWHASMLLRAEGVFSTPELELYHWRNHVFFFFWRRLKAEGLRTKSSLQMCFDWLTQCCKFEVVVNIKKTKEILCKNLDSGCFWQICSASVCVLRSSHLYGWARPLQFVVALATAWHVSLTWSRVSLGIILHLYITCLCVGILICSPCSRHLI